MSKLSIHSVVSSAFGLYFKHLVLLGSIGVVAGLVGWASLVGPRYLAQRLGVYQEMPVTTVETVSMEGSGVTDIANRVSVKIAHYLDTTAKGALFVIFLAMVLLWVASMLIHLGFIKVALQLVDKNKSSFDAFFSVKQYLLPYIGGSLLFVLYSLVIMAGSSVVMVPIFIIIAKVAHLSAWTAIVAMPLVVVGASCYLIRYVLFSYCIIDKNVGARDALAMSAKITDGNRLHVFLFFFAIFALFTVMFSLIKTAFGVSASDMQVQSVLYMVAISVTITPLIVLMVSKMYRQLTGK